MGQLAFLYFLQKKGWLGVKVAPHELTDKEFKDIYYGIPKQNKEIFAKMYTQVSDNIYKLNNVAELDDMNADIFAGCFRGSSFEKENGWGSGTKTFIRDIFAHCIKTDKNFFDDYLEPLFYDALNKRRGENHYYKRFNCKIPFLNGGLFDPLENYDWKRNKFEIPNELFSNQSIKGKDEADGILDIFDRYNFTMNEDEPLEKEVAVDPEMLGKIFENLLDIKDRKSKGAFYTPREIVHYMCQESLINYLVNKVDVPYEDMKSFILYGELMKDEDCSTAAKNDDYEMKIPKSVYDKLYQIDRALQNVKVADPAVGSGAFPLGMLTEIVKARVNITEYLVNQISEDKKYERFLFRKSRHPYKIKWETIKNCIFAVDIEHSAVDIAKLRLWLSIVVEQEIDEENPYPHALPNLDCNIMCGNSLIDEFEGIKLFDESLLMKTEHNTSNEKIQLQMDMFHDQMDEMTEHLFDLQDKLFGEDDTEKKKDIKKEIDSLIDDIIRLKLSRDNNHEDLKKYEEILKQKTKPYFLWYLEFGKVFKENGGFDIVIGNPPYIKIQNINEVNQLKHQYRTASGKFDIYILFIEKAFNIIRNNGIISYIHPHRFLTVDYGKGLRDFLSKNKGLKQFIHFGVDQVFETATTYTGIFFYSFNNKGIMYSETNNKNLNLINFNYISYENLGEKWLFKCNETQSIISKIQKNTTKLLEVFEGVFQGVITVGDDIFILEGQIKGDEFRGFSKALNQDVIIEAELMKPLLKGENIRRYKQPHSNMFIFYPHYKNDKGKTKPYEENELKFEYPKGFEYICNFKNQLIEKKIKYKTNPKYWYSLHRPREIWIFNSVKLITPQLQNYPNFTLDNNFNYPDAGGYSLIIKDTFINDINYYLGILNSSTFWYFIKNTSTPFNNSYYYFKSAYIEPFCFPDNVNNSMIDKIIDYVNELRELYKLGEFENKERIIQTENNLNNIIYMLYNFNDKEIQIIENSNREKV